MYSFLPSDLTIYPIKSLLDELDSAYYNITVAEGLIQRGVMVAQDIDIAAKLDEETIIRDAILVELGRRGMAKKQFVSTL